MKLCLSCGKNFGTPDWKCPTCGKQPAELGGFPAFAPELSGGNENFNPDHFQFLARREAENFWFVSRNRLIFWALKRYFPLAANFFEIGCGTGFVLSGVEKAFPKMGLSGSELHAEGLQFAAGRVQKAALYQIDVRHIPFQEEFDVIGAFDVLEHVKEDGEVFQQMFRAVRKGGGILLTVPQHPFLWSSADEKARHFRRYTRAELRAKAEAAGFRVVRIASFVSLLLPLMLLSRLRKKETDEGENAAMELNIPPFFNLIFGWVMAVERFFLRMGLSLHWGGSLFLVGRKE